MPPLNAAPHPLLANLIQTLWFVERDFTPSLAFDVLPDSRIELIFNLGVPCQASVNGRSQPLGDCFVVGLLDQPVSIQADGRVILAGVRFYPWGFSRLMADHVRLPLNGLSRPDAEVCQFQETLARQSGSEAVFAALQAFLLGLMLRAASPDEDFVAAARRILSDHGDLDITALAEATGTAPRTLRRRFQNILGMGPKGLARTARFEYVRDALWNDPDAELSQLALAAGYADQAHMQREFRQFGGRTPRRFAEEMRLARARMRGTTGRNLQES